MADDVALKYDTHLDFHLSDSALECHRDHLRVDDFAVKGLTMKESPATSNQYLDYYDRCLPVMRPGRADSENWHPSSAR